MRTPYILSDDGNRRWSQTVLPSRSYTYAFVVDCANLADCITVSGNLVIDTGNLPFKNIYDRSHRLPVSSPLRLQYSVCFRHRS